MTDVVLLTPPLSLSQRMGMLAEGGAVMPGLGILYIAAFLRKEGFNVAILDAEGKCLGNDETVQTIKKHAPKVLGITTTTVSIASAVNIAKMIKTELPDIKIFFGGPHVTALPLETLESSPEIDGCVIGDGEISFSKIVGNILSGLDLSSDVDGLVWREGGKISFKQKERHLDALDTLPLPAWDLLEGYPKIYRPPFHSYRKLPVANIITTRGCPHACSFCDRSVFGNKMHSHSVEYVVEMVSRIVRDFGIREISIKDDMFITSPQRVSEFCRELIRRNLNITWSCNARVNYISDDLLKEMRGAGCWMISFGIESGSPVMLKKMMKGINKEQIKNALKLSRNNGIVSKGFFMIGIPGETTSTMEETLDFVRALPLDEININFFTPFPGSRLFNEVLDEGFVPDFSRMNMLDTVYVPKGLTEKELREYQKKMIYAFYLRPSKIARYVLRAMMDFNEFKRISRMVKMFAMISLIRYKGKAT